MQHALHVLFLLVLHFFLSFVFVFCNHLLKMSIQKENTCYSIAIGEQEYSHENTCVGVSF